MSTAYENSLKLMLETLMSRAEENSHTVNVAMLVEVEGFVRSRNVYGGEGDVLTSPCLQDFPISQAVVTGGNSCPRLRPLVCELVALHPTAPDELLIHRMVEHISQSKALLERLVDTVNAKHMKEAFHPVT